MDMRGIRTHSGFTLIELLTVVAIIGVIVAVVVVSLEASRQSSRDANRISQSQEILKAVELYFSDTGMYPDDGVAGASHSPVQLSVIEATLSGSGHLPRVPSDPSYDAANGYQYCSSDDGLSMALLVNIENELNTNYCAIGRGPQGSSNTLCAGLAGLDRCNDVF